jgi:hypothetical protein
MQFSDPFWVHDEELKADYLVMVGRFTSELEPLADGARFPNYVEVAVHCEQWPQILMDIQIENGRPEIQKLEIKRRPVANPPRITSSELRDFPLGTLTESVIKELGARVEAIVAGRADVSDADRAGGERVASLRRTRRQMDDAFLSRVAEIVREHPGAPRPALNEAFGGSRRSATQWITLAQDRGFLPKPEETEEDP